MKTQQKQTEQTIESYATSDINMNELNRYLKKYVSPLLTAKCGQDLQLGIVQDAMQKEDHECELRLLRNQRVISSLKMMLFLTCPDHFDIMIESETVPEQRRKKYNTLLRVIGIILATKMTWGPWSAGSISSIAVSWISVHLLLKLRFQVKSILSQSGPLEHDVIKMYKTELRDKDFLMSKMAQGKTSRQDKPWKLIKMELSIDDGKKIRRRARRALEESVLPTLIC